MINLYLLVGLPGSGKSTWAKCFTSKNDAIWISRDVCRYKLLSAGDEYFSKEELVWEDFIGCIQDAIIKGRQNPKETTNIIVDATHLNKKSRDKVLNRIPLNGVDLIAVNFMTPIEQCLKNNAKREGRARVPNNVIYNMYDRLAFVKNHEEYKKHPYWEIQNEYWLDGKE
jgi:predicted kinase